MLSFDETRGKTFENYSDSSGLLAWFPDHASLFDSFDPESE